MPETIPRREKLDALTLVAKGHTRAHVARLMHLSVSTIQRAKRKQRLYGDIEGGKKKMGRRAIFTPEIINVTTSFSSLGANRLTSVPCD
jgi:Helix-turn-helix domain